MSIPFKSLIKNVTGISTPIFGVSWNPPETDREIVRKLFLFLEDKRALYYPYHMEIPFQVTESVLDIRKYLTQEIMRIPEKSVLITHYKALRAACRKFLDINETVSKRRYRMVRDEMIALGELRASFGIHIAQLAVKYGIDVDEELEIILPAEDRE